ncbi:MAG: hypothetical protein QF385_15070, partial [SAR324 cluster bacterium]|nr:hypothetical protein [SAR324 cluster bacterium]
ISAEASNLIKDKNSIVDLGVQTPSINFKVIDKIIDKNNFSDEYKSNLLKIREKLKKNDLELNANIDTLKNKILYSKEHEI